MLQAPEPSPSPSPSPIPSPSPSVAPTEGSEEPIVVRDHRTVRSYPANLGHNVVEVWRKPSLMPFLIGSGVTALSFLGDDAVIDYFDSHPAETWGKVGKFLGTGVVAVAASTAVFGIAQYANGDRFKAAARHAEIDQYDVGPLFIDDAQCIVLAAAFAGDLEADVLQTARHALPEQRMVVDHCEADGCGHAARTSSRSRTTFNVVPRPEVSTANEPPRLLMRWRRPARPSAPARVRPGSKPDPVSDTSTVRRPAAMADRTFWPAPPAWRWAFASPSWTKR